MASEFKKMLSYSCGRYFPINEKIIKESDSLLKDIKMIHISEKTMTFAEANNYINRLSLGGYNDWRFPHADIRIKCADDDDGTVFEKSEAQGIIKAKKAIEETAIEYCFDSYWCFHSGIYGVWTDAIADFNRKSCYTIRYDCGTIPTDNIAKLSTNCYEYVISVR